MTSPSTSIASLDPLSPEPLKPDLTSSSSVGKELLAGTVAGWAQVFVGQPCKFPSLSLFLVPRFDTYSLPTRRSTVDIVKVRLQAGNVQYAGPLDCAQQLMKKEGALGFYKGESFRSSAGVVAQRT